MARRATVIKQAQENGTTLLVLDAGDSLIGDRDPAKRTMGATSVTVMNMLGYDAMALGPKELELGLDVLRQRIADAKFAVLSANAVATTTNELVAQPYVLRQLDGHGVAIIGLSGGGGSQEIAIQDPVTTIRATVEEVAAQADIIIVLSSAGVSIDQEIAESVPDIDIIISGGRKTLPSPRWVEGTETLILHADESLTGHAGRRMGIAQLAFNDEGQLAGQTWQLLSLGPGIANDPEMDSWVLQNR